MIGNLQILRAFAATGVVMYHAHTEFFGVHTEFFGVALFFVLSGYLMCRISNRKAVDFALDRFWRIVPAYWLAIAILLTAFSMWGYWPVSHVIQSFLFIPHQSPSGLFPVLGVGWTLNFEVYFYVVFTIAILISRRFAPICAALIIILIFFLTPLITNNEAFKFYYGGNSIWFFVGGIAIWYGTKWLEDLRMTLTLPNVTLPIAIGIYAAGCLVLTAIWPSPDQAFIIAITLAPLLFLAAILASLYGADIKHPLLMSLGNASYACYLLHTILIEYMRHQGTVIDGGALLTVFIVVASWAVAIAWHYTVERAVLAVRRVKWRRLRLAF